MDNLSVPKMKYNVAHELFLFLFFWGGGVHSLHSQSKKMSAQTRIVLGRELSLGDCPRGRGVVLGGVIVLGVVVLG